jgi:acetyl-CoA acyltransferase
MSTTDPVVVVDGCRTPFQKSGTGYTDLMSYDLARMALAGLLHKSDLAPEDVDHVVMGCVVQDMNTSNVAREAALAAGFPNSTTAHTVTMACISSNMAIATAAEKIMAGQADIAVAGGTETASDVPIRFKRSMRKRFLATQKYRKPGDWLGFVKGMKLRDLAPEVPSISEFSTGLTMGQSCDRVAALAGVTREEQDAFALRSHRLAAKAIENGMFAGEVLAVQVPPDFGSIDQDNGPRGDSTLEQMAKLRPAFHKPWGTATAANSSFLTDGASATLLMKKSRAEVMGYKPLAAIRDWAFAGSDQLDELLLGPAFSTPIALDRAGVSLTDIDVFEVHEAFAGSVLAAIKLLDSKDFAKDSLGRSKAVGAMDMDKVNTLGGSLSLGHPFGATGARLVMAASRRLQREDGQLALVTACAAGGLGHAMILDRI